MNWECRLTLTVRLSHSTRSLILDCPTQNKDIPIGMGIQQKSILKTVYTIELWIQCCQANWGWLGLHTKKFHKTISVYGYMPKSGSRGSKPSGLQRETKLQCNVIWRKQQQWECILLASDLFLWEKDKVNNESVQSCQEPRIYEIVHTSHFFFLSKQDISNYPLTDDVKNHVCLVSPA